MSRELKAVKIPKNRKIVTCTVDKELWEFMKKKRRWFGSCHNDAEMLMQIIHYFVDMEEVKEEMDREAEARMFRL